MERIQVSAAWFRATMVGQLRAFSSLILGIMLVQEREQAANRNFQEESRNNNEEGNCLYSVFLGKWTIMDAKYL